MNTHTTPRANPHMALQGRALSALPGIAHAFFTREGGVSTGLYATLNGGVGSYDDPGRVAENRAAMAQALGVAPDHLLSVYQIHSADVVVADKPWPQDVRPRADGIVTRMPGLAIAIATADCGPILFADAEARVIGAAHAGWRGAQGGIIEATLSAMEKLGAKRARITAALGPTISQKNYEVGPEFVESFTKNDSGNSRFFEPAARKDYALFDLPAFIAAQMQRAGVGRFEDLRLCTYADEDRFFSYRRATHKGEPDYGRHINAIALAG